MPFIWNDERAELVEDSANFNRSEFVVARKIFVRFNEDAKVSHLWALSHRGHGHSYSV